MQYDSQGPALTDSYGYYMEHCKGLLTGTQCLPAQAPQGCAVHGIPFPNIGNSCSNGTKKLIFFDFISSNSTNNTADLSNYNFIFYNLTSPITLAMMMAFPFFGGPGEQPVTPQVNLSQIYDIWGNLLFDMPSAQGGMGGGPPGFIAPYKRYTVRVRGILNSSGIVTPFDNNYSFLPTVIGMSGAIITIKPATEFTTFIGKVINSSGAAISNGVVYAQPSFGFTPPMGISIVNSSFTDGNGIFRIRVPKNIPYKFLIAANDTNAATGSLIYNPTIDTNNGRGYFAQQDTVILPPSTIQSGGTISVTVILNGANGTHNEISRVVDLPAGPIRDAFSSRISPMKLFETVSLPASIVIALVAPINNVLLNLYGINIGGQSNGPPAISHVCFNTTSVAQGQISNIYCTLNSTPGTLNLIVNECRDSLFTCSMMQQAFNIWFDSRITIYRNGAIVANFEDGSIAQEGSFSNPGQVQIKLPPGNYNLTVSPKFPFNAPLGVYYNGSFVISPSQTTNVTLRRQSPGWQMQPQMPFQMRSSANSPVAVAVYDFGQNPPAILNDTRIRVNIQALQLNGSYAGNMSAGKQMQYFPDIKIPGPVLNSGGFNTSFRPGDYNIPAGKYLMLFNASTDLVAVNQTQFSTFIFPFTVSDFDIGVEMAKFSWATSETLQGKIFAFLSNGTGLSGNATITFYDFTGVKVGGASTVIVTAGEGLLSIPVSSISSQSGFYEMLAVLNASGTFGFANNFMQITNFIISTSFDKQDYKPEDLVKLTLKVFNSSNSPIQNASIEGLVDSNQNSTYGSTDSTGSATLSFDPGTITGGNWTFGFHSTRLKIAYTTATEVIQQEAFAGFQVKGFDVQIRTDKPSYQPTENVTLLVYFIGSPQEPKLLVDGVQTQPASKSGDGKPYVVVISPPAEGGWSAGRHNIEFSFTQGASSQSVFAGFEVTVYSILVSPDRFSYQLYQNATITVKVINATDSTPVIGAAVAGTLYKFQQSGDLQVSNATNVTASSGTATLTFNLTKAGFNYVKIVVNGNQNAFVGFLVSGMAIGLTLNKQAYSPGDSLIATINVTGANASNASVSAKLFAFGSFTDLPTSSTYFIGSGATGPYFANISYTIPSDAPGITYFLDVKVTLVNGDTGFGSAPVMVSGGQKISVEADKPFTQPYKVGEMGIFTATLLYGNNNTGVNGTNVSFEIGSSTGTPSLAGSALTDGSGKAALSVPGSRMPGADGAYYIRAYVTGSSTTQAYTGFSVSSLIITISSGSGTTFSLNQTVTFNVTVINGTSGLAVTPTSGSIIIWDKNRGQITLPMAISGSQPYSLTTAIPNDVSAIGTYTVIALMNVNSSFGSSSLLITVKNQSTPVNITLPSIMNASIPFFVNISVGSVTSQLAGSLRVFSPSAANVSYINNSITFISNVSVAINISTPGKYIFLAEVTGYGTAFAIGDITSSAGAFAYRVWTTNSTSAAANDTSFSSGETVYIWSNAQNTTAIIMTQNQTTNSTSSASLSVVIASGTNYYTSYAPTATGSYFVRLDTATAAGTAVAIFKVT